MNIAESVKTVLAPPHKAGYPFILGGFVAVFLGTLLWHPLSWAGWIFAFFCLYFFRDPERVTPARAGVFVAPADGLVVAVGTAIPPLELGMGYAPRVRVAIFLSVLDVHVNRAPVAGVVEKIAYHPGRFLSAAEEKASDENERNAMLLRLPGGEDVVVVQIAGLIARRILCEAVEGQTLAAGQRFGMIRFGSRTDVYLPVGSVALVEVGQRMVGGETVISEIGRI